MQAPAKVDEVVESVPEIEVLSLLESLKGDKLKRAAPGNGELPLLELASGIAPETELLSPLESAEVDKLTEAAPGIEILSLMETSEIKREILGIGVLSPLGSVEADKLTEVAPEIGVLSSEKRDKMSGKQDWTELDLPEL
jgi:hypothetical protein